MVFKTGRLSLPAIAAPMFSSRARAWRLPHAGAALSAASPASTSARPRDTSNRWMKSKQGLPPACSQTLPIWRLMANLNAHKTSLRHDADLAITVKHCVPLVITSLGAVKEVVDAIHEYGGHVFHDVISIRHAEKGLAAGVDRVIAVRRQGRRGQRNRRSVQRAAFRRFPKSWPACATNTQVRQSN